MNKLFTLIILFISALAGAQELSLSLDEAIAKAMEHNPELNNAQLDVESSEAKVKEVLSTGLPQVNGNVNFTHNLEIPTSVLPDFISPSVYGVLFAENLLPSKDIQIGSFPAQFGVPYSMQATVGLNQLVFDGTYFLGLKAASEFVKINELIASKSEIDVREGVMKAYYMALISEQNLIQLDKSLTNLEKVEAETKAMYEAGFAEKLDHDRIILSVSTLKVNINNLKMQSELALKLLLNAIGLDVNQDVSLTTSLPEFNSTNFNASYGADLSAANRIEFQMLEQQQLLNSLSLKRYKMGYIPSIYLNANMGYNTFAQDGSIGDLGAEWFPLASYGLNLNIPIFDGLYKKAKSDQVKIDIMKTDNSIAQLTNGINLEVAQSRSVYINALQNMELQKNNMELAESIYNTTTIKFKEGVGSSFEMVQAESDLTTANTNYLNALYQLNIAKISLDKALGNL
ncbi:MAG: TolC family protein [Bacteroidia bacterium]